MIWQNEESDYLGSGYFSLGQVVLSEYFFKSK
jgi:hypothetical protein